MKKEYYVMVEGVLRSIIVSDEETVLLAAKAAKRAVLGLYDQENFKTAPCGIPYLAERETPLTEEYLERIIRRQEGLPWKIRETKRLVLREMIPGDWGFLDDWTKEQFKGYKQFLAYIKNQYPFYEYGMWSVVEKEGNVVIGTAGIHNPDPEAGLEPDALEIGYGIRHNFRRNGYGREAVEAVIRYSQEQFPYPLYARIREENIPSQILAVKCGFMALPEQNGAKIVWYRYGQNWKSLPHNMG